MAILAGAITTPHVPCMTIPCLSRSVVTLHVSRLQTVHSQLKGNLTMATTRGTFAHQAELPGETTHQSLADVLDSDSEAVTERLKQQLDLIRDAEREAERSSAEVRLY